MPFCSIIVPVYKTEEYLEQCVRSILNQTMRDFELILVDDGSPDRCPEMCDAYANEDSRIRVIHKENGGLSDARNAGLQIAKGKYIAFVDSDDLLAPNALEILFDAAKKSKAAIVITERIVSFTVDPAIQKAIFTDCRIYNNESALEHVMCDTTRWEAWGSLYKQEIFENEVFPAGRLYEDLALIPRLVLKAKEICFIDSIIYYYRLRNGSIMHDTSIKQDLAINCEENIQYVKKVVSNETIRDNVITAFLMELASRMELANSNIKENAAFILKGKRIIRSYFRHLYKADKYILRRKIYIILSGFGLVNMYIWVNKLKKLVSKK